MPRPYINQCLHCTKTFSTPQPNTRYCDQNCRKDALRIRNTRTLNCRNCDKNFTFVFTGDLRIFCGHSCSAIFNNPHRPHRGLQNTCARCKKDITRQATYCNQCPGVLRTEDKISNWIDDTWRGGTDIKLSPVIRSYLIKQANYTCTMCDFNTPHPIDGASVLEIDHIDGDGRNHRPENLTVLCPNHHTLTSTYRGRNRGKGRPVFYTRTLRQKV